MGNYYYHYCCLYCLILQNNIKIIILTFMNVDGAFILAETHRRPQGFFLLTADL